MYQTYIQPFLNILLNPIITALIGFFTLRRSLNSNKREISRERLDSVYHPLFLEIEPFLYKNVKYSDIEHFVSLYMELEKEHSLLITPLFRQQMHNIYNKKHLSPSDKYHDGDWNCICKQFSKDYDKLCKYALIPTRSIVYRLYAHQYKSKFQMCLAWFWVFLPFFIFISFILGFFDPNILYAFWLLLLMSLINQFAESIT